MLAAVIPQAARSQDPPAAGASPAHGIAMFGDPNLPAGFAHLPYANPDAPKGGRIVMGEPGSFDSLNPFILKGRAPFALPRHVTETLMIRSIDEPFTLYGLLAESVTTDAARSFVEFTLRPEARFSDGSPVTVEDVIWSFRTLGTEGHPLYRGAWTKVADITSPGSNRVRIDFREPDRELALLMGLRPVLKKAQWEGRSFADSTLEAPIGSGPYVVDSFEPGRFITFRRNPDWWGKDLPVNRGLQNLDEIRYEFFTDQNVMFEAFKAGALDVWREQSAQRWQTRFDFPALAQGRVVQEEIPHRRPAGITGLVFNTRQPIFADWRVREALTLSFDHEFIAQTLTGNADPRIGSWFANSDLAMQPGPASGRVAELLAPFAADLAPGTIEGYALPVGDGRGNRANLRRAMALLEEAGWTMQGDRLRNAAGQPFRFEILLQQGGGEVVTLSETHQITDIWIEALRRIGAEPVVTMVDAPQFVARTNSYDFDVTWYTRALSLSPGNEQMLYWGARGVDEPGTRNWMGMGSPAAEAMIRHMLEATDPEEYRAAVQALDRVLSAGRWVIPVWYQQVSRIAYAADLHHPEAIPLYGDWPGFLPDVWWRAAGGTE
nr:extracellular solute-binding protein [Frigidibacter oleivorans]